MVVMPFNNLFGLKAINGLAKLLPRHILICCHGEMEAIASDINSKGLLSKILHRRCIKFFLNPKVAIAGGIRFAVLGDSIRNNLEQYINGPKMARFVSLDHPYIFSDRPPIQTHKATTIPLRVGTAGAISRSKGVDGLIAYAKACREKGLNVSIRHTGRIFEAESELVQLAVDLPATHGELSRSQYDERLSALDYMLFFYNPHGYKITASGAIMDALAIRKPIIALRNDYFEYLFEKFGAFGYLVDDVDQMVETTARILSGVPNEEFDFDSIRDRLSPDCVLTQFGAIINQMEK